jgi:hypothetical protein
MEALIEALTGIDSQIQSKSLSVRTNVKEEEYEGLRNRRIRVIRECRSLEDPGSSY